MRMPQPQYHRHPQALVKHDAMKIGEGLLETGRLEAARKSDDRPVHRIWGMIYTLWSSRVMIDNNISLRHVWHWRPAAVSRNHVPLP